MSNCNSCCGIGSKIILPSDPKGNVSIRATGVFGGIQVSWTYPTTNPHAIAYWRLFKGTSLDFNSAVELGKVSGSQYIDQTNEDRTFYYWIRSVSVNGTESELIGPASAKPRLRQDVLADDLHGQIHNGWLANHLREPIESIARNYNELRSEIDARILSQRELAAMIDSVRSGLREAGILIHRETTQRIEGQNALARDLQVIGAANKSHDAAIIKIQETQVSDREATARQLTQMHTRNEQAIADAKTELKTYVNTEGQAISQRTLDLATANMNNTASALRNEMQVMAGPNSSLVRQVNTLEASSRGVSSKVQTLSSAFLEPNGQPKAIWSAKVDVNGRVGGFGLVGTNQEIEVSFDVDKFWIGSGSERKKPFIVHNDKVYIDKLYIGEAWIGTEKLEVDAISKGEYSATFGASGEEGYYRKKLWYVNRSINISLDNLPTGSKVICILSVNFKSNPIPEGADGAISQWAYEKFHYKVNSLRDGLRREEIFTSIGYGSCPEHVFMFQETVFWKTTMNFGAEIYFNKGLSLIKAALLVIVLKR